MRGRLSPLLFQLAIRDVAANMAQISKSSTEQSASLGEITMAVR
jgi:methyl-accepting chemotaxis protein